MSMLSHIKVLELSDGLVDFGGRMLCELGAQVIAVVPDADDPAWRELARHHGKRRIVSASQGDLLRLAEDADIVLDGRRQQGGLPDALSDRLDQVIHVVARPFSGGGPLDGRPATDLTLMALSGLMTITGDPDRPPLRLPGEQAYALVGIQVATAALLGLAARRRTGRGQRIEVSAFQSAVLANYREAIMFEWTGRIGRRTGNRLVRGSSGVRQVWPCLDGFVTWSMIDNPGMMRAVVRVMVEEGAAGELAEIDWDAILVADTEQAVIDRWQDIVASFFARHDRARLGQWSLEHGWGLSTISTPDEVRESDHLAARGLFVDVAHGRETTRLPGPLFLHGVAGNPPERRLMEPVSAAEIRWEDPA